MSALRKFARVATEVLREIFDENAYARLLSRQAKVGSAASYADFVKEKYDAPVKRCC